MQNRKLIISLFLISFLMVVALASKADGIVTLNYGDITLTSSGATDSGHFDTRWNLVAGDMVISFTYDANGIVDAGGWEDHAWAELGLRAVGYGDFNPASGAGVWLATDHDEWQSGTTWPNPNTFASDADSGAPYYPILDLDDKLILQKVGGQGEGAYDLPGVPPNPGNNHRVWWDRDGVDPYQNDETATTGGVYQIVIALHATSATSGEAYMTIRGLAQGFETDGNWNTIELTPAGMTFTFPAETCMQVFYALYGYGATHSVAFKEIKVTGVPCEAVGGEWISLDTLQLLTPWIGLASTIAIAVSYVYGKRLKRQLN
jgi:hypothetical protein